MKGINVVELAKNNSLPRWAGIAELAWKRDSDWPRRCGSVITLPLREKVEYVSLLGGKQFLLISKEFPGGGLYFGGTDEQPFLFSLEAYMIEGGLKDEQSFYQTLKPEAVSILEERLDVKALRQGYWFAVPLLRTWDELSDFSCIFWERRVNPLSTKATGYALGGTRSRLLNGRYIVEENYIDPTLYYPSDWPKPHDLYYGPRNKLVYRSIMAEGILRSPEHCDLELAGPHALFQSNVLRDLPEDVDANQEKSERVE